MKRQLTLPMAVAALAFAPVAHAHVTLHPNVLPAGQFVQVVVRVPNERQDAATTKIEVRFPPGFIFVSHASVPGWTARIQYRKLTQPVTVFGERHTEEVGDLIWSGSRIEPGQFLDFPLSVAMPDRPPGTLLTFKALQTYSNGEVVRWIGSPSSDTPAPQVALADEEAPAQDVPEGPALGAAAPAPAASSSDDSTRENVALGLGVLGTVAGLLALAVALTRRRTR
jgi:periplasmic copper chaperone A